MKKIKDKQKLVNRNKKIAAKLKRRLKRIYRRQYLYNFSSYDKSTIRPRPYNNVERSKKLQRNLKKKAIEKIRFPQNFSLIKNHKESLPIFETILHKMMDGLPVYFDKLNVKQIGVESILYLIATLDRIKHSGIDYWLSGAAPQNKKCKEIFIQSGFYNYVKHKNNQINYNKNYFQIKSGNMVDPEIAKSIVSFAKKHLDLTRKHLFGIYRMLIELMCNTREHAYPPKNGESLTKWYVIAQHDKSKKCINFCFLDTGVGIPSTVTKSNPEKIIEMISFVGEIIQERSKFWNELINGHHSELIESALKGAFRTRTGQAYRGKGLPCIYGFSEMGYIDNLVVISHKGFVECRNSLKRVELGTRFFGTMYSWRLTREDAIEKCKLIEVDI